MGVGVGRVVSQPGTGLMQCEYSLNFSELSFSSTPVKNGAGSAPQMGSGDKGDLNRVPGEGGVQSPLVAPAGRVALVSNRSAREAKGKRK